MTPSKIYEIGDMLGIKRRDITNLVPEKSNLDIKEITSPIDTYKGIILYGTVSIKDFKRS